jgi:glycosyltransferase involved in cell wall biosynthesis
MTGFVANSAAVRDHFSRRDGLAPDRITIVRNGLDAAALPFRPPSAPPRRVGILGNLNRPVKRIDLFVEATGRLAQRFPEVSWEIVGDGELRPRLEARARELGVAERTTFHGRLAQVGALLGRWDIGVLCSDSEGFSNALLEYMLAGAAVVATAVGGNREVVEHDVTGLLVPPGDAGALAAAIARLLAEDGLAGRLAAGARSLVENRFSWETCVRAHEDLYRDALRRRGVAAERAHLASGDGDRV